MINRYIFHTINEDCTFIVSGRLQHEKDNNIIWSAKVHSPIFSDPLLIPVMEVRINHALDEIIKLYGSI